MCCVSWGCKEADTTEQLNWLNSFHFLIHCLLLEFKAHVGRNLVCCLIFHPLLVITDSLYIYSNVIPS